MLDFIVMQMNKVNHENGRLLKVSKALLVIFDYL